MESEGEESMRDREKTEAGLANSRYSSRILSTTNASERKCHQIRGCRWRKADGCGGSSFVFYRSLFLSGHFSRLGCREMVRSFF